MSETFVSNKVKHLHDRGNEIFVYCNKKNNSLFEKIFGNADRVKVITFSVKDLIIYLLLHPWQLLQQRKNKSAFKRNLFDQYRLHTINRYRCDIIHFEFSGVAVSYLHILDKLEGKKIVSCRGTAENVNLVLYAQRQKNIRELFEKADAVHCVSGALKNLISSYCTRPEKIFVNRPAVDTTLFTRQHPVPSGAVPVILSVGRFMFQKGYVTGMLAIRKLKEMHADFKWVIVGDGAQYEEILFMGHQMKLQDHVSLPGKKNMDEVMQLYNTASVFFLPSITEGIANVALEAMSMELPVVSTRCGGMEEVIADNVNGLLADVYDHDHLAENLLRLLKDKHLRERLGTEARKTVTSYFDSKIQITRFEEVYRQLIQNTYPASA